VLILVYALIGVAGVVAGGFAFRFVREVARSETRPPNLIALRRVALAVGVMFGVASWPLTGAIGYAYRTSSGVGRIVGLPFMVAYFDATGHDYLSPLTLPAALGNSIFFALCPQIILSGYVIAQRFRRRPQTHPHDDA